MRLIRLLAVLLTATLVAASSRAQNSTSDAPPYSTALAAATHDLCHRHLVLLGESATHGDGATEAFKVALVQQLVTECGFRTVLFESSQPEFLHLTEQLRARSPVTPDDLASAIGGLWRFDQGFQPLLPFLLDRARSGKLALGGIDDQLGQLGQTFSNDTLPVDLTAPLPEPERSTCRSALHDRIYGSSPTADPAIRARLTTCLADAEQAISTGPANADQLQMLHTTGRWLSRDSLPGPVWVVSRDRSMVQSLLWTLQHEPPRDRRKVILWAATVHISKQADPTWGDHTDPNLGQLLHQQFGKDAFSLGFAAGGGSFRQGRHGVHPVPPPAPGSLEAQALAGTTVYAVYLGPAALQRLGTAPAAIFYHTAAQRLPWSQYLDGLVVLREEHPPASVR